MITTSNVPFEDFVPFTIAKLLKEKGFDEPVQRFYDNSGEVCEKHCDYNTGYNDRNWLYPCATIQSAVKWLREVHHILIETEHLFRLNSISYYSWAFTYTSHYQTSIYQTYEDATLIAIEYALRHLVNEGQSMSDD